MRFARLASVVLSIVLAAPATAQQVQRREVGAQIFEDVAEAPAAVKAGLARYQNARTALFGEWMDDGSMLIRTRFGATYQLHRVGSPGSARQQITFYDDPVSSVSAVPGSDRFVFSKDSGGDEWFQYYLDDGKGGVSQLTETGTRNFGLVFTPDGRQAIWARSRKGSGDTQIVAANLAGPGESASTRLLHETAGSLTPLDVSPDGQTVLLARYVSVTESELYIMPAGGGPLTRIAANAGKVAYSGGEFTSDGQRIITLSDRGTDNLHAAEIRLSTGEETNVSPDLAWDVEAFDLSPDGRTLAYAVNEDGYSKVRIMDMRTRRALVQPNLPTAVIGGLQFSQDSARLAIGLSTPTSAGDVWSWDLKSSKLTRWTTSELGGLDAEKLVEPDLVRFISFDGLSVPAFIYKPTGGGKHPVVIDIHGGPEGQSRPAFNPIHQHMVAELGAAVIVPNVRGSTGYGKSYVQLDNAEKREDSVKDIGALLDWIAKQPDLDANRVVVYGQSYGGYMVLASMTHFPDRLAAGIDRYGISNWTTFLTNTESYRRDLRRAEYGDERDPAMRAVFDRISPLNNVEKIKRPMLIMQGSNDPRVPQSESDQMVRELRARGVPVGYVVFRDEGHGFTRKPNNDARREAETVFLKQVFGLAQ